MTKNAPASTSRDPVKIFGTWRNMSARLYDWRGYDPVPMAVRPLQTILLTLSVTLAIGLCTPARAEIELTNEKQVFPLESKQRVVNSQERMIFVASGKKLLYCAGLPN